MKYTQSLLFAFLVFFSGLLFAGSVNINTADVETLTSQLNGIGEKKAMAIIEYRDKHGGFVSVDELTMVKGIGEATLEKIRDNLTIE